jgi:anthranilate phosphoribosyltransferase
VSDLREATAKLAAGERLDVEQSARAFEDVAHGNATPAQLGAFLMALRVRGETVDEIVGAVTTLRKKMLPVDAPPGAMDVVGTGGDSSGSYNISTGAAFVVAGAGQVVAKHGNRAVSSRCGAADVLAALGVEISLCRHSVARCLREAGIGFMFAPAHHPALQQVATVRVELGIRTIFNLVGPLVNPARVKNHMIGVYSPAWTEPFALVLDRLGSTRALIVCGSDGLDEITTTGPTAVTELDRGRVRNFTIRPEDVGLPRASPQELVGGDADENAAALRAVLEGSPGPYRDVVLMNAAAGLVVAGRAATLREGVTLASQVIDSGRASASLEALVRASRTASTGCDCDAVIPRSFVRKDEIVDEYGPVGCW